MGLAGWKYVLLAEILDGQIAPPVHVLHLRKLVIIIYSLFGYLLGTLLKHFVALLCLGKDSTSSQVGSKGTVAQNQGWNSTSEKKQPCTDTPPLEPEEEHFDFPPPCRRLFARGRSPPGVVQYPFLTKYVPCVTSMMVA